MLKSGVRFGVLHGDVAVAALKQDSFGQLRNVRFVLHGDVAVAALKLYDAAYQAVPPRWRRVIEEN